MTRAGRNRWSKIVILTLFTTLLCGCESLSDLLVRQWFIDQHFSHEMSSTMNKQLKRKEASPPATLPRRTAPPFLDQG